MPSTAGFAAGDGVAVTRGVTTFEAIEAEVDLSDFIGACVRAQARKGRARRRRVVSLAESTRGVCWAGGGVGVGPAFGGCCRVDCRNSRGHG